MRCKQISCECSLRNWHLCIVRLYRTTLPHNGNARGVDRRAAKTGQTQQRGATEASQETALEATQEVPGVREATASPGSHGVHRRSEETRPHPSHVRGGNYTG